MRLGNITIHRLIQTDSFSDGTFTYGIISGSDDLLDLLISQHKLEPSSGSVLDIYSVLFDVDALPVHDNVYANERLTCFQDRDKGRVLSGILQQDKGSGVTAQGTAAERRHLRWFATGGDIGIINRNSIHFLRYWR